MKITVIGLGKMGSVLVKRLLQANFQVTVFNRTAEKMQASIQAGASGAATLKDAVENAEVVITSLFDDSVVSQVVAGFVDFLPAGAIHIGTSTILPETSKKLFDLHQSKGSIYLAGNVLGVPKAAERGELTSIVAGDKAAIEQCQSIFMAYSTKLIVAGVHPYQANVVKICMNYMLATAIEAMGELYTFAEKNAVDLELINSMFHSIFGHPAFKLYVDKIKDRDFSNVNFDLKGGFKDISLFQQAFANVFVVPDIINVIKDKFVIAMAHNMQDKDWSAVTEITRKQANIV